jgi:hypothetical protein
MRRNARQGGITDESVSGIFVLARPLVWFVKTNSALNAYRRSLGARRARPARLTTE